MTDDDRTLDVAAEVADLLASRGASCAVIRAVALAVRGYPRATEDLDLLTVTDFTKVIGPVARELEARGCAVELSAADADDRLRGVVTVRARADGASP